MTTRSRNAILKILLASLFLLVMTACSGGSSESEVYTPLTESEESVEYHHLDVNSFKLNKVVCDPMGQPGNPGMGDGLIAELFHMDSRVHQHSGVQDFFDKGTPSDQKLFFTDINVPTRGFDAGFPTEAGTLIQNDQGEDLVEYFALRFKSVLKLGPNDAPGDYELALLSDDGALLKVINIDGQEEVLVDNDGIHPSRFGCSNRVVSMDESTALDVRLEYFQGPRHHIALIPMWRKVDANTAAEKECGRQGNGRYFQFNNNSKPKKKYEDLLQNGWKPIAAENWELPPSSIFNPCNDGTPAKMSNVLVTPEGPGAVRVTWETDIPATGQVLVLDVNSGQDYMTDSDNVLRTSHSILVEGLTPGGTYNFQGVSVTSDLGKTLSRVFQLTL